jgi:hypothetical protein
MAIQVLIEPVANNGFRARSGEPLPLTVEAPTREEALATLKQQLQERLQHGGELVSLPVQPEPHPASRFIGMYNPKDPHIKAWKKAMAAYRRKIDKHPEMP